MAEEIVVDLMPQPSPGDQSGRYVVINLSASDLGYAGIPGGIPTKTAEGLVDLSNWEWDKDPRDAILHPNLDSALKFLNLFDLGGDEDVQVITVINRLPYLHAGA
jgi:hypothetical protein